MKNGQVTPYVYSYKFTSKRGNRYVCLDISGGFPVFKMYSIKGAIKSPDVAYMEKHLEDSGIDLNTLKDLRRLVIKHHKENGDFKNVTQFIDTLNALLTNYTLLR